MFYTFGNTWPAVTQFHSADVSPPLGNINFQLSLNTRKAVLPRQQLVKISQNYLVRRELVSMPPHISRSRDCLCLATETRINYRRGNLRLSPLSTGPITYHVDFFLVSRWLSFISITQENLVPVAFFEIFLSPIVSNSQLDWVSTLTTSETSLSGKRDAELDRFNVGVWDAFVIWKSHWWSRRGGVWDVAFWGWAWGEPLSVSISRNLIVLELEEEPIASLALEILQWRRSWRQSGLRDGIAAVGLSIYRSTAVSKYVEHRL
jgi:hypothetical protein